jgi:hypothetical protein
MYKIKNQKIIHLQNFRRRLEVNVFIVERGLMGKKLVRSAHSQVNNRLWAT